MAHGKRSLPDRETKRIADSTHEPVELATLVAGPKEVMARFSHEEREEIADILRVLSAKPQRFKVQFLDGASVQDERSLWAADAPAAVRMAVGVPRPADAAGIRVVDPEGGTVFERQNADFC